MDISMDANAFQAPPPPEKLPAEFTPNLTAAQYLRIIHDLRKVKLATPDCLCDETTGALNKVRELCQTPDGAFDPARLTAALYFLRGPHLLALTRQHYASFPHRWGA